MRKLLILAAVLLIAPAVARAKSLEDLLVEKGVITKAEARGATSSSASKVYWNNGTRFEFPDSGFTASFATFLQERYTFTDNDEDAGLKNRSSFDVNTARIIISGTALNNEFAYYLEPDFSYPGRDPNSTSHGVQLLDAYLTWNACDWAAIKMGQYKTFISRQFNTADWKLQFPDRTVVSNYFDHGRQSGLSGQFATEDNMFVLSAGLWNGESDGEGMNISGLDTKHTGGIAVRINPMGKMDAHEEADVNYTEDFALSLGAAYLFSDGNTGIVGGVEDFNMNTISVDAAMKYQGFSLNGEFFWAGFETDSMDDSVNPLGFYAQAGYFLMPKKFEVAARYGYLDCDDGQAGSRNGISCAGLDKQNEVGVALNYYWWKHNLKASVYYAFINESPEDEDASDINTNKWMFQLSSYF